LEAWLLNGFTQKVIHIPSKVIFPTEEVVVIEKRDFIELLSWIDAFDLQMILERIPDKELVKEIMDDELIKEKLKRKNQF